MYFSLHGWWGPTLDTCIGALVFHWSGLEHGKRIKRLSEQRHYPAPADPKEPA